MILRNTCAPLYRQPGQACVGRSDFEVSEDFLSSLADPQPAIPSYINLVKLTVPISCHISLINLFRNVVRLVQETSTSAASLDERKFVFTVIAFGVLGWFLGKERGGTVKPLLLTFLLLLSISPVLRTLTQSVSEDSIEILAWVLLAFNALLADYTRLDISKTTQNDWLSHSIPSAFSTNTAISAAVVLASQLNSDLKAFGTVLLSLEMFVLLPLYLKYLRSNYPALSIFVAMGIHALTGIISKSLTFILIQAGILSLLPALYIYFYRKYKNRISAHWNVARPVIENS